MGGVVCSVRCVGPQKVYSPKVLWAFLSSLSHVRPHGASLKTGSASASNPCASRLNLGRLKDMCNGRIKAVPPPDVTQELFASRIKLGA